MIELTCLRVTKQVELTLFFKKEKQKRKYPQPCANRLCAYKILTFLILSFLSGKLAGMNSHNDKAVKRVKHFVKSRRKLTTNYRHSPSSYSLSFCNWSICCKIETGTNLQIAFWLAVYIAVAGCPSASSLIAWCWRKRRKPRGVRNVKDLKRVLPRIGFSEVSSAWTVWWLKLSSLQ